MSLKTVPLMGVLLAVFCSAPANAAVLFSDDFSSGALDANRWTPQVDSGCSLSVGTDQVLHAYFTGANASRRSFALSSVVQLPENWTSFTITGDWAYVTKVYGEMVMQLWDADDSNQYIQVAYKTYLGDAFRASYTGGGPYQTSRSVPTSLSDFEWTVTPTGWTFRELRGTTWTTLANYSTTHLADANAIQFKIGGWEYSATLLQRADYDNIEFDAVPEPLTAGLLAAGGALLLRRRRK
ncbi:MAG TPA: PEP-CTERM sorting domain-containing protein [Phycisphaerae bacterium]|nr:PEP-CTERM sorting domain-containing protein [Phycisphaerae bacterium]